MGSVEFEVGDESQPRTNGKKCKSPRTISENGGAVNHAPVPRKLRSATKKQRRKSVAPHLPIIKKRCRVSNGIEKLGNNGGKKSKPNMKQGHITKDEEEVAETLFALAGMFSDANRAKPLQLNDEPPENKSSAIPEAGCSINVIEGNEQKPELGAAHVDPRPMVSTFHVIPSVEQTAAMEQVTAHRIEYDMNSYPVDDKDARQTQVSCLRMPESTHSASEPFSIENKVTAEKQSCNRRCLIHVYISHLIKDLKVVSERKERSLEKPTPTPTCNQITGTSSTNGCVAFMGTTHLSVENDLAKVENGVPWHKRGVQDPQLASETSASCSTYQGFNLLSLCNGAGGSEHRARLDTPNQFHAPYVQSQGCMAIYLSPAENGYSAAFHGHNLTLAPHQIQPQLPQHPASTVNSSFTTARLRHQPPVYQRQKWGAELATHQYNTVADGGRMSGSMLNYTHAMFPHLQSSIGYHQPLTLGQQMQQQQQQLMMRNHIHLPSGLQRNAGAAFCLETTLQPLQIPSCNHHFSN